MGDTEDNPIFKRIDKLKEVIRKTPVDELQERIYNSVSNGCILLTAYKIEKGAKGWSSHLHNDLNEPMLNSKEQMIVEDAFAKAPWILEFLNSDYKGQKGGAQEEPSAPEADAEADAEVVESASEAEVVESQASAPEPEKRRFLNKTRKFLGRGVSSVGTGLKSVGRSTARIGKKAYNAVGAPVVSGALGVGKGVYGMGKNVVTLPVKMVQGAKERGLSGAIAPVAQLPGRLVRRAVTGVAAPVVGAAAGLTTGLVKGVIAPVVGTTAGIVGDVGRGFVNPIRDGSASPSPASATPASATPATPASATQGLSIPMLGELGKGFSGLGQRSQGIGQGLSGLGKAFPGLGQGFSGLGKGAAGKGTALGKASPAFTSLISNLVSATQRTETDISFDLAFEKLMKKMSEMDTYWGKFAYEMPGIANLMNDDLDINIFAPPFINVPVKLLLNFKMIITFIITFLDSIRFSAGYMGVSSPLLTLVVLLEEIITGQWRQAIFTSLAFISPSGGAIGVIFKYIINATMLINPDIRTDLARNMYKGTKSLFIGFLLWAATTFTPNKILKIVEVQFNNIREKIDGYDDKVKAIQDYGNKYLAPLGKKLNFSGFGTEHISKISINDIQTLQSLATWDLLICSTEFQSIVGVFEKNPMFRFILELMNIPTTYDDKYNLCHGSFKTLAESIDHGANPRVSANPDTPFPIVDSVPLKTSAAAAPAAVEAPAAAAPSAPEAEEPTNPVVVEPVVAPKGGRRSPKMQGRHQTRRKSLQSQRRPNGAKKSKTL